MVYKALKAFKTLPKYSKLEDEIDELNNDNKAMSKRIESLEKELCLAKEALNIYQDMEQGNGQYSDKDFEVYKTLQTKIDDIYFSKRTTNVLAYMDIKTIADLVQYKKNRFATREELWTEDGTRDRRLLGFCRTELRHECRKIQKRVSW